MTRGIHFIPYLWQKLTMAAGISLEKEAAVLYSWRPGAAALVIACRGGMGSSRAGGNAGGVVSACDDATWGGRRLRQRRPKDKRDGVFKFKVQGRMTEGTASAIPGGNDGQIDRHTELRGCTKRIELTTEVSG
jgi:hypothetical protein